MHERQASVVLFSAPLENTQRAHFNEETVLQGNQAAFFSFVWKTVSPKTLSYFQVPKFVSVSGVIITRYWPVGISSIVPSYSENRIRGANECVCTVRPINKNVCLRLLLRNVLSNTSYWFTYCRWKYLWQVSASLHLILSVKVDIYYSSEFLGQGCTKRGRKVSWASEFCRVAPNTLGPQYGTFLMLSNWLLEFWSIF